MGDVPGPTVQTGEEPGGFPVPSSHSSSRRTRLYRIDRLGRSLFHYRDCLRWNSGPAYPGVWS